MDVVFMVKKPGELPITLYFTIRQLPFPSIRVTCQTVFYRLLALPLLPLNEYRLMVDAAPHVRAIVTFGDSITDGANSTPDANHRAACSSWALQARPLQINRPDFAAFVASRNSRRFSSVLRGMTT